MEYFWSLLLVYNLISAFASQANGTPAYSIRIQNINSTNPCREGFLNLGSRCYKYSGVPLLSHSGAVTYCRQREASLVDVNPNDATNEVFTILRRYGYSMMSYWVNVVNNNSDAIGNGPNDLQTTSTCSVIGPSPDYVILAVPCDSDHVFVCQHDVMTSQSLQRGKSSRVSCSGKYGFFPHPSNCRRFIFCINGNRFTYRCSSGRVFSAAERRCVIASKCISASSPGGGRESGQNVQPKSRTKDLKCEAGYWKYRSQCFRFYVTAFPWDQARQRCSSEGGRLATIRTRRVMLHLRTMIKRMNNTGSFWIGLNNDRSRQVFAWSNGDLLARGDYSFWSKRSRRRNARGLCVKLDRRAKFRWMDRRCSERNFFICEKEAMRTVPVDSECGLLRRNGAPRYEAVVGGTHAQGKTHPWQASLRYQGDHKCGGSLIDSCWIMTAAHCVSLPDVAPNERPTEAVLGDYNLVEQEEDEERLPIEEFYVHPEWEAYPIPNNDIAILKLRRCSRYHNPICMPSSANFSFPSGTECNIAGYGTVDPNRRVYPTALMEATVPLIERRTCESLYRKRRNSRRSSINSAMFCAGFLEGGTDACQGDSGGPLTCRNVETERETQWGIVSWGNGCAEANKPGVYTRVVHFYAWIRNVTRIDF